MRWWRPGKATLTAHVQPVPMAGIGSAMSVPTIRAETGLPTNRGLWAGPPAELLGAAPVGGPEAARKVPPEGAGGRPEEVGGPGAP